MTLLQDGVTSNSIHAPVDGGVVTDTPVGRDEIGAAGKRPALAAGQTQAEVKRPRQDKSATTQRSDSQGNTAASQRSPDNTTKRQRVGE
mmetsp:Transcript_24328/g.52709  ORF Transcript_24328/g.52709 Transcript_24328/m.52709 type:complete len:89 (-) Transcript_24328:575-841(-)